MDKIEVFINRMSKLHILIELSSNYPWIYLDSVNGNEVNEQFYSEHAFTIGFLPVRKDQVFEFIDIKELFKVIRKYK